MRPADLNFLAAWVADAADPHNPADCRALNIVEDIREEIKARALARLMKRPVVMDRSEGRRGH